MDEKMEFINNIISSMLKDNMVNSLEDVIYSLQKEECFDEDIYEYINQIVLTILHSKYENIMKQLKNG